MKSTDRKAKYDSFKQLILDYIVTHKGEHPPSEISIKLGIRDSTVRKTCSRLYNEEKIGRKKIGNTPFYFSLNPSFIQQFNKLMGIKESPKKFEIHGLQFKLDRKRIENDSYYLLDMNNLSSVFQKWNKEGSKKISGGEQFEYKYRNDSDSKKDTITIQFLWNHILIYLRNSNNPYNLIELIDFWNWFKGFFYGHCGYNFIDLPFQWKADFNVDTRIISCYEERFCYSVQQFDEIIRVYTKEIDHEKLIREEVSDTKFSKDVKELVATVGVLNGGLPVEMIAKEFIQHGENQDIIRRLQKSVINLHEKDNENRKKDKENREIELKEKESYRNFVNEATETIRSLYKKDIEKQKKQDKLNERISKLEMRLVRNDWKNKLQNN